MSDRPGSPRRDAPGRFTWTPAATTFTPRGFVQGGAVLGATIDVLERTTERECRWAHAQFGASIAGPEGIEIRVENLSVGRHLTQGRAICGRGDVELMSVQAAFGSRPFAHLGVWRSSRSVPAPADCPSFSAFPPGNGDLGDRLELRLAHGDAVTLILWARRPDGTAPGRAELAVIADFAPLVFAATLEAPVYGNSLDNMIRFTSAPTSEWTLLEIEAVELSGGIGIARAALGNESGALVADASQSAVIRSRPE